METVQPHFVPKVIKPKRNPKKEGCSRRSSPGLLIDTCGSSSALRYGWNDDSYICTENVLKLFNLTTRAFQELFNLTTRAFQVCGNKSCTGTTLFVPHFVPRKVEKRSQPWLMSPPRRSLSLIPKKVPLQPKPWSDQELIYFIDY